MYVTANFKIITYLYSSHKHFDVYILLKIIQHLYMVCGIVLIEKNLVGHLKCV